MSRLGPADYQAASLHLTPRGAAWGVDAARVVGRVEFILDHHAVCAAVKLSNILGVHVAGTCSAIALRGLADADAARGICAADYANRRHAHTWLVCFEPITLDANQKENES